MTAPEPEHPASHVPFGDADDPSVRFTPEPDGRSTRVEMLVDGRSVSRCWIVSLRIRIGEAEVRMDGIGGVGTDQGERHKGYSRRVLDAALRRIDAGDAALSMLYGIPDYYVQFGYVPSGPDHLIRLPSAPDLSLPTGWAVRSLHPDDVPILIGLYAAQIRREVGAAVRPSGCYVNRRLGEAPVLGSEAYRTSAAPRSAEDRGIRTHHRDRCRVLLDPDGGVRGYAWRGDGFWASDVLQREAPECLIVAEAIATDDEAAWALLDMCATWAHEVAQNTGRNVQHVMLSAPHDGRIGRAAGGRDSVLIAQHTRGGGSMARITHMERLVAQMAPELRRRLADAGLRQDGPLTLVTGLGRATIAPLGRDTGRPRMLLFRTSWFTQAVLGAALPYEHVEREMVVRGHFTPTVLKWIRALFPSRCPHMYLPDRY